MHKVWLQICVKCLACRVLRTFFTQEKRTTRCDLSGLVQRRLGSCRGFGTLITKFQYIAQSCLEGIKTHFQSCYLQVLLSSRFPHQSLESHGVRLCLPVTPWKVKAQKACCCLIFKNVPISLYFNTFFGAKASQERQTYEHPWLLSS